MRSFAAVSILCLSLTHPLYSAAQVRTGSNRVIAQESGEDAMYMLRVDVVERLTSAINYRHRSGSTTIGFRGTPLQPGARGEAKVESKQGYIEIEVEFDDMIPASRYGAEYLTYVMWAVTPQGRAQNLGEVILNGTKSKLNVTTELQAFGLVITAEPYFAVTQPSDRIVLENYVRPDTVGKVEQITARYELLGKGQFAFDRMPPEMKPFPLDATLPLDLQQARNAVRIAQWFGAERYAPDVMAETRDLLFKAEDYFIAKSGSKPISMIARQAVQSAEDARLIALRRKQDSELDDARRAAELRERRAVSSIDRQKREMRETLVTQLNRVFNTKDTARGLVVGLTDNLFDSKRSTLRRDAREKLARVAGLLLAHPGLNLNIEANSSLSRRRADTIREYLAQQGVRSQTITSQNSGRGAHLDLVVSGQLID